MEALSLFDTDLAPAATPTARESSAPAPPARPAPPDALTRRRDTRSGGTGEQRRPTSRRRTTTLLAIDGNSLAHRAFHAYHDGDRGAAYGFCALLAAVCDRVSPDAVVVGFDCREHSERRQRFPEYKANRGDKAPELVRLLDELPILLRRLGVDVVVAAGWEADDVLGSAAATAEARGWRCVLATSDRDAFSLVSDTTTVLRLRSGMDNAVVIDRRALVRSVGVEPEQYVDFAALRGDVSDNLPGIPGIGKRRAVALLSAFPNVPAAVADPIGCRSVLGRALGQELIDDLAEPRNSVYLRNVALMTIRRDVPIDVGACRRSASADAIAAQLAADGLGRLGARMAAAVAARPDMPPPPTDTDAPFGDGPAAAFAGSVDGDDAPPSPHVALHG